MAIVLFDHNQKTYNNMCFLFATNKRVAVVQPTGTGKSFLYMKWMEEHTDQRILVVSPSRYIFKQLDAYQKEAGVRFTHVQYLTYAKLANLEVEEIASYKPDFIVLDEFHRCGAKEWGRGITTLLDVYEEALVLGTSATPIRYLDSCRNMAEEVFHGTYAVNMSIGEALEQKILPTPIYIASYYSFLGELEVLEERVKQTGNERLRIQLYNKIKKAKRMLLDQELQLCDIFKKHMRSASGKYIVFCSSEEKLLEAMEQSCEWFVGLTSKVHQYKVLSSYGESATEFEAFSQDADDSAIKLLFCVDMLNEGIHVAGIDGVIMLRSTESLNVYYQQLGRALTCVDDADRQPMIFDLVNNFEHGRSNVVGDYGVQQFLSLVGGSDESLEYELYDYILDLRKALDEIRNTFEQNWEYNYESVKEFVSKQGRFPYNLETYHDIDLGSWCIVQRRQYQKGILEASRVTRLDEIDFIWNPREEQWYVRFEELKAYMQIHGKEPKSNKEPALYIWLSKQKAFYIEGTLPKECEKALLELSVSLEKKTYEDIWQERYETLREYVSSTGSLPSKNAVLCDIKIGAWLVEQKTKEKNDNLSEPQKELLEQLGVTFRSRKEKAFDENVEILKKFVDTYKRFPNTNEKYEGFGLGVWCSRIREEYQAGELQEEQVEVLQGMHFDLRSTYEIRREEQWNKSYAHVQDFVKQNGRLPRSRESQAMYGWLKKQKQVRELGVLSEVQVVRLRELNPRVLE
ncbi:MAG: Helicase associated domain protein [Lachnospiraceae bacterium]